MGLAISKKIVELFQGEVNVESEFGKGSVFSFTIHTVLSKEQEEDVSEIVTVIDESLLGLRILLVDDKQVNLIVARTMLLSLGCKVELAKNGKEAIDIYEKGKFDIVLMDVQMPIMDGVEAATLIKEKDREMNSVIALTANAMEGDREKYISLGFDEYLSKPIEYEVLKHKLIQVKNRTSKN